jgi:hypothetical protein
MDNLLKDHRCPILRALCEGWDGRSSIKPFQDSHLEWRMIINALTRECDRYREVGL